MAKDIQGIVNVTEIVRFSGFEMNEAEAAAFETVKTIEGNMRSYHGAQVDDASNGIWFQEWESLAYHVSFQQSEVYPTLIANVPKFAKMAPEVLHVQFKPYPPTPSFEAPLVEVLIATLKAHATKEEFEAAMAAATNVKPKVANASSGIALEDERKYIVVEGWESLEKVQEMLSKEGVQEAFGKVRELADIDVKLYKLSN